MVKQKNSQRKQKAAEGHSKRPRAAKEDEIRNAPA